jgi:hypothetical protein
MRGIIVLMVDGKPSARGITLNLLPGRAMVLEAAKYLTLNQRSEISAWQDIDLSVDAYFASQIKKQLRAPYYPGPELIHLISCTLETLEVDRGISLI